jgi:hypothetical protein
MNKTLSVTKFQIFLKVIFWYIFFHLLYLQIISTEINIHIITLVCNHYQIENESYQILIR